MPDRIIKEIYSIHFPSFSLHNKMSKQRADKNTPITSNSIALSVKKTVVGKKEGEDEKC